MTTIDNGGGERLTFLGVHTDERGDYVRIHSSVAPGGGPPMHVHHLQDEGLTIESGELTYVVAGEEPRTAGAGESITFKAGVEHKFYNAGNEPVEATGWVGPPNNIEYYLTQMFAALRAGGGKRPRLYDAAYLSRRYRSEFTMTEIPMPVQRTLFVVLVAVGRALGWEKRFAGAPAPVTARESQSTPA